MIKSLVSWWLAVSSAVFAGSFVSLVQPVLVSSSPLPSLFYLLSQADHHKTSQLITWIDRPIIWPAYWESDDAEMSNSRRESWSWPLWLEGDFHCIKAMTTYPGDQFREYCQWLNWSPICQRGLLNGDITISDPWTLHIDYSDLQGLGSCYQQTTCSSTVICLRHYCGTFWVTELVCKPCHSQIVWNCYNKQTKHVIKRSLQCFVIKITWTEIKVTWT